jgi:PAS domain S-box-containing protein
LFKRNLKPDQFNNVWSHLKNTASWWVFVLSWLGFFVIVLALTPQASRLLLLFLAIPFFAPIFFAVFTLASATLDARMYQTLFEQNDEGIIVLDLNGKIMDVNQHVCEMFGYTKGELVKLSFRDVIAKDAIPQAEAVLQQLLAGKSVPLYERLACHKDGTLIPIEVSARLIRDTHGKAQLIQSAIRDITQRKQIEQAIINSEKRLRVFADILPNRVVIFDRDGNYRDVLKYYDIGNNTTPKDVIGKNLTDVFSHEKSFAEYCLQIIHKALDENAIQIIEYSFPSPANDMSYITAQVAPFIEPQTSEQLVMWISQDISERRRIEQAVINSEKRLRVFAESLPDRAVILDREGNYREILKNRDIVDEDFTAVIGRNVSDVFNAEFAQFCKAMVQKTLDENKRQTIEYVYHEKEGNVFLEGHITPLTDPETGEAVAMWVTRDVTERKRIEQAIINSEKRLRTFAEALPDRAVIFDREGTYRDVLRSRYADLKYVYDDVIKRNVSELYDAEFAAFCKQMVEKTLDENKPQLIEYVFHNPEGDLYLEGYLTPLTDPETGEEVVLWVIRDISERKRSQQALADSEARLRTFAEILPDRVVVLDNMGHYRDVLKHWYDRSNFQPAPENTTGKTLYDVLPKDFADFCLKIVRQTLNANTIQVLEYTHDIGGQLIHFEGRVAPFNDPKSGERLVMWVSRNITERVHAEEQHLELTVEREKLTYLRNFVDSIVHDLKTPLTVIRTSLHLLERTQDESKRKTRIAGMYTQVDIITQMLDDLLALARLDTMPNLPMDTVDLQRLLEEIMVYLRPKAEHQSQDVDIFVETDALEILASADELRRALTNLIDNAIKYTPEYGTVSIRIACEGHETLVEVKDTGIGIKAEDLPHLFDRFFRSDNAKSHATGTGLGLAITKRIIELHGGRITVESQYQQGSTFSVWLPANLNISTN